MSDRLFCVKYGGQIEESSKAIEMPISLHCPEKFALFVRFNNLVPTNMVFHEPANDDD
ncbi:hypothetical protein DSCO28_71640 [Desulfosarcina ovata subsp. sediminis]|uniref:Uncharacterized protein n=1 Tax=Desulfosarcina ovata subsp. sediminis TaxID=885957 RepID=A0A5K8A2H2_9BACT|nr:hypothetical protein DSCO28_71640 [Desulfosarcina ovata subsp. sediminis]